MRRERKSDKDKPKKGKEGGTKAFEGREENRLEEKQRREKDVKLQG